MELTIQVASQDEAMALFGLEDRNLKLIRDGCGLQITARNGRVRLAGDAASVGRGAAVLNSMISMYRNGIRVPEDYVEKELARLPPPLEGAAPGADGPSGEVPAPAAADEPLPESPDDTAPASEPLDIPSGTAEPFGEPKLGAPDLAAIHGLARSRGQEKYLRALLKNEVVFCSGPAGTGKTFLAVRMAVNALREGQVRRLILCRPAVEAGEKLGFLPGDFHAKINPYLRPLYDALNDILGFDQVKRYLEREIIEILPLAYMRGRTLNHAFIILDEGQNTTISQMKMFLTRMGLHSRIIVNGDTTQVDLPSGQPSGLIHAQRIIKNIRGIAWVRLEKTDIVRHHLVKRIIEAYESESRSHR